MPQQLLLSQGLFISLFTCNKLQVASETWRQCIEEDIPFLVDLRLPEWVEGTDADITGSGRPLVRHCREMLRLNAEQLWQNLIRQGWRRVPPQW